MSIMRTKTTTCFAGLLATVLALSGGQLDAKSPFSKFNPFAWNPSTTSKPEPAPVPNASKKAELQMSMGRSMERQGRVDEALIVYQDILKKDSRRIDANQRLAIVNDQLGNFEESDK